MIKEAKEGTFLMIDGIFNNHLEDCAQKDCTSKSIAEGLDGYKEWVAEKNSCNVGIAE